MTLCACCGQKIPFNDRLEVDPDLKIVRFRGEAFKLSAREVQFCEALAAHYPRPAALDVLCEYLYGPHEQDWPLEPLASIAVFASRLNQIIFHKHNLHLTRKDSTFAILTKTTLPGAFRMWTDEEDELIISLHPSIRAVCDRLPHRTYNAVWARKAILRKAGRVPPHSKRRTKS